MSRLEQQLIEAARRCDGATLKKLVTEGKVNINTKDKGGCTAVHLCCKAADLTSLALLLEHGARTDVFDNNGMAPIHHAAVKDYTETMAVLVSYGADINIKDQKSSKTSFCIAYENSKSRSIKFLLFCGANIDLYEKCDASSWAGLSAQQLHNHRCLADLCKNRIIDVFGKMIYGSDSVTFNPSGLRIANTSLTSRQLMFFCRKLPLDHIDLDLITRCGITQVIKDDTVEVISDVYEYLVNQTVDGVTVTVPAYTACTYFDTVLILDSMGNKYRCNNMEEINQVIYYSASISLKAYEDTVYSFVVALETKADVFVATGFSQTITSTVEDKFSVHLPETCLPKYTTLSLKVIPTSDYHGNVDKSIVQSASHFCQLSINKRVRCPLNICLPLPKKEQNNDDESRVLVFHTDETTQTPSEWTEVETVNTEDGNNVRVVDSCVSYGTCIVTKLPRQNSDGFLSKVKEAIKWLYETAIRRKAVVEVFAMTKFCSEGHFRLLVGLSDQKQIENDVKIWQTESFVGEKSQRTCGQLVTSQSKFQICLKSDAAEIKGCSQNTLVYQKQKHSFTDFIVRGNQHDFLQVNVFKSPTVQVNEGNVLLAVINVELLTLHSEVSILDVPLTEFTEYPDSALISWMSQEIGNEWLMLGIFLGLKFSYLEGLEKVHPPTRANLMMLITWRTTASNTEDLGLSVLIKSLITIHRNDMVSKINKDIRHIMSSNPAEPVCRWVTKLSTTHKISATDEFHINEADALDDVDGPVFENHDEPAVCLTCLLQTDEVVSPYSEQFLAHLVTHTGSNLHLILQLGFPQSVLQEIRQTFTDPLSAMLKCVLIVRRRFDDYVKFYRCLLEALRLQHNLEAVHWIQNEIKKWLKTKQNSENKEVEELSILAETDLNKEKAK